MGESGKLGASYGEVQLLLRPPASPPFILTPFIPPLLLLFLLFFLRDLFLFLLFLLFLLLLLLLLVHTQESSFHSEKCVLSPPPLSVMKNGMGWEGGREEGWKAHKLAVGLSFFRACTPHHHYHQMQRHARIYYIFDFVLYGFLDK